MQKIHNTQTIGHQHITGAIDPAWRKARLNLEAVANAEARKAEAQAVPAHANPGPARTTWSNSDMAAKFARNRALNIAEANRRAGIVPDPANH